MPQLSLKNRPPIPLIELPVYRSAGPTVKREVGEHRPKAILHRSRTAVTYGFHTYGYSEDTINDADFVVPDAGGVWRRENNKNDHLNRKANIRRGALRPEDAGSSLKRPLWAQGRCVRCFSDPQDVCHWGRLSEAFASVICGNRMSRT
jgi:hypothetical protein